MSEGRQMPKAIDLEESILSSMLLDTRAMPRVMSMIQDPSVFYGKEHEILFQEFQIMNDAGIEIDLMTVAQRMKDNGKLDKVGGVKWLSNLSRKVSSSAHIDSHCRIVLDKWLQRELIRGSADMHVKAFDSDVDVVDVLTEHQKALDDLVILGTKGKRPDLMHFIQQANEEIMALSASEHGFNGIPTGFEELNRLTGGWRPGEMIVIGARPKMGKTALATRMAKTAVGAGYKTVFVSGEMTEKDMVKRMMALEAPTLHANQFFLHGLKKDAYLEEYHKDVLPSIEAMNTHLRVLRQTGNIRPLKMELMSMKTEWGLDMIILDYLQLYDVGQKQSNRTQEVSEVSRAVKNMALDLDVPVIALAQLSREVERRPNKRPMLSDLKESGSIEQDADKIIFIYRDEYYMKDETKLPGIAEVIVEVQRNGAPGMIYTGFDSNRVRFHDDYRFHGVDSQAQAELVCQEVVRETVF